MYKGHLSFEEIEQLSQQQGPAENQVHIAHCRQCHVLLEKYQAVSAKLEQLASVRNGARSAMNCPDERVWFDVAAATLATEESLKHVQHAAECWSCAQKLRSATKMFQNELTPEEDNQISALPSAKAEQQKKLAQQLAYASNEARQRQEIPKQRKRHFWWPVAFSLAGATAIAVIVFFTIARNSPTEAEKLLAIAYNQDRRIEMRIPYAKHAEIRQQRGIDTESYLTLPEPFRKATDIIAVGLQKDPTNPRWILLEARLDLLRRNYSAALAAINKIPVSKATAQYHLTLGTALLEKGEAEADRDSYLQAIEQLSAALNKSPRDPIALFNRALAYDKLNLPQNAIEDWKAVLDSDTDAGWQAEASQYLETDNRKVQNEHQLNKLLSPEQINNAPSNLLDNHAEQLQEIAAVSWLTEAARNPEGQAAKAARKLAIILKQRHFDPWLWDLLTKSSTNDILAFAGLSRAIRANGSGHYAEALNSAGKAATIFHRNGNEPGELRARLEEVYAVHRFLQGSTCLTRVHPLVASLSSTLYQWLRGQAVMEKAVCENYAGDLQNARKDLALSRALAQHCRFPVLLLRNFGLAASIDRQQGQFTTAWNEIESGLDLYWSGDYPQVRLYQLYMVLGLYAEQKLLWNSAEALESTAIKTIENGPDRLLQGTARLQLVNVLVAQEKDTAAAAEIQKADAVLGPIKRDPLTSTYRLTARIELSTLQLRRGNPVLALETLDPAADLLDSTQGYFIFINFYQARGDIYLALGHLDEASRDYLMAMGHAESSLESLTDLASRRQWIKESDRSYRGLVRVTLKQGRTEAALRIWEWYRNRSLWLDSPSFTVPKGRRHSTQRFSVDDLQNAILNLPLPRPDQSHVIYGSFEDGLQIWILGPHSSYGAWVPVSRRNLEELTTTFLYQCATPSTSLRYIQALGLQLYDILLRPALSNLAGVDSVVFELDSALSNLPLEALFTPEGKYVGERISIVYSPGYFLETILRKMRRLTPQSSALLVEASASLGQIPLAGYNIEKKSILMMFPKATTIDASTVDWALVLRHLESMDFAHILAHGEREGTSTALILSLNSNRKVSANDFSPRHLSHLQLAVLAGCRTSAGNEDGIIDPRSLVHPFLSAGVPNIIATRWNVDSEKTAQLMAIFYAHLHQGESPQDALRAARGYFATYHPYYWAAFILIGRSVTESKL